MSSSPGRLAVMLGLAVAAIAVLTAPVLAGEDVEERETVERRSMKIETLPPPAVEEHSTVREEEHHGVQTSPSGRTERHSTTEEETHRRVEEHPRVIEKHTTVEVPSPPVVRQRERTTEERAD